MARRLVPYDVHAIMNSLVKQATGQQNVTVVDTSTFISAGETVLSTGVENTLNSLAIVLGRTMIAVRPYKAPLNILNAIDTGSYTSRLRKISFYSREAQASGDWNTQLYTNLLKGYDNGNNGETGSTPATNSTASMWEQNPPVPLEMNFGGLSVWEDSTTVYKYQLKQAFRSETEFADFVAGILTEKANDIESQKEAYNRAVLLNGIAGTYDMNSTGSVINLTKEFNDEFGTTYTSEELRTTYYTDFLKFFVSKLKYTMRQMAIRSSRFHWSPPKTVNGVSHTLLRHTPISKQRLIMLSKWMIDAEANVYPEIFNTKYLDIDKQYEQVDYWQSMNNPSAINITPAVTDKSTGLVTSGANVALDYVLGILYDEDAIMTDYIMEDAETTPMEARKRYYNMWWSFARNGLYDPTENAVIFIMKDED